MARVLRDAGLSSLVEGEVETLADGFQFTEGPLWLPDGSILFQDIKAERTYRVAPDRSVQVLRENTGAANGQTFDGLGRIVFCEQNGRRVSRMNPDGSNVETVAEHFEGKRLNSPNDIICRSDGQVFFTDPPYGVPRPEDKELPFQAVFALDATGQLRPIVSEDFEKPNGLALSPDEMTLYVNDTAQYHVRAFALEPSGAVVPGSGRVLATFDPEEKGGPDGLKVDREGRLYVAVAQGVWVLDPDWQVARHPRPAQAPRQPRLGRPRRPHARHDGCGHRLSRPHESRRDHAPVYPEAMIRVGWVLLTELLAVSRVRWADLTLRSSPLHGPLAANPGVGLGEELANLGVVEQGGDLVEGAPAVPVAGRVLDVLGRAGERGDVVDLDDEVGDRLEHLATAADVGVREALLEALAERPVRRLVSSSNSRAAAWRAFSPDSMPPLGNSQRARGLRTVAECSDQVKQGAVGGGEVGDDPGGILVQEGHGDRESPGPPGPSDSTAPPGRPASDVFVFHGQQAEHGPGLDPVVLPAADLGQSPGRRRRHVERGRTDQHLDQPVPLPDRLAPRRKPVADDDRHVRTGPQVGQDHCLQTHGEPRFSVGLELSRNGPAQSPPERAKADALNFQSIPVAAR